MVSPRLLECTSHGDPRLQKLVDLQSELIGFLIQQFRLQPEEAEDIFQDIFLKCSKIFEEKPDFTVEKAYFFVSARNLARNRYRDLKRRQRLLEARFASDPLPDLIDEDAAVLALERDTIRAGVKKAMARLGSGHQEILSLFYTHDLTYSEIAERLAVPIGTVMSRLSRAKAGLKAVLGSNLEEI